MGGRPFKSLPSRRDFLRQSLAAPCFLIPLFRNGALGQPVLAPNPWFAENAAKAGLGAFHHSSGSAVKDYLVETLGSGVALFDYNNDGLVDVLLVNGSSFELLANPNLPRPSSRLFRNNGDGTFTDVTKESGLLNQGWGMGVTIGDYDNDGFRDVFITNFGSNALFHNNGDGTFTNVTKDAGLEGGNWSTGCAWGDYDRDGRLDLYISRYVDFEVGRIPKPGTNTYCNYRGFPVACGPRGLPGLPDLFYHNEDHGKFREVSRDIGVNDTIRGYGLGVMWLDFDNDGWPDIFVANDSMPNYLWRNKGNGTFEEVAFEAGCALSADGRAQSNMGIAVGDYDNDGWLDLFVTHFSEDYNTLYHNNHGKFEDVTFAAGLGTASYRNLAWGTGLIDFDNDGWKELFVANGHIYPQATEAGNRYFQQNQLYTNLRNGRFASISGSDSGLEEARSSRGAAFADLGPGGRMQDGRMNVIVNNIDNEPFLYEPARKSSAHWARFKLEGVKCNRDAIGARVSITAGGLIQIDEVRSADSFLSSSDVRLHFGLGDASHIDRLKICWPDGTSEERTELVADREHTIRQGGGS
ncbi:MAG TPA: CRTAC1 family protein [Candidatus Sulfotelmatobacter sp.]|nr:CRTAC1 family protein [Candidatus Sulfotelmatobacter sp.]